jgi:hypothetical protein
VIVLEIGVAWRSRATVNCHLTDVFGFYDHQARAGVGLAADLVAWRRVSRGSYKPFLHHVTKGRPIPHQADQADGAPPDAAHPRRGAGHGRPTDKACDLELLVIEVLAKDLAASGWVHRTPGSRGAPRRAPLPS